MFAPPVVRRAARQQQGEDKNALPAEIRIGDWEGPISKSQRLQVKQFFGENGAVGFLAAAAGHLFEDAPGDITEQAAGDLWATFLCGAGPGTAEVRLGAFKAAVREATGLEPKNGEAATDESEAGNDDDDEIDDASPQVLVAARSLGLSSPAVLSSPAAWGATGASPSELRTALRNDFVTIAPPGWQKEVAADLVEALVLLYAAPGSAAGPRQIMDVLWRFRASFGGASPEDLAEAAAELRAQAALPRYKRLAAAVAKAKPTPQTTAPQPARQDRRRRQTQQAQTYQQASAYQSGPVRVSDAVWARLSPDLRAAMGNIRAIAAGAPTAAPPRPAIKQ